MQNIKKRKRKYTFFMHFLKVFTKNSYFLAYAFFTKRLCALLLLFSHTPGEHKLPEKMPQSARRLMAAPALRKYSAAAQPYFCIEQSFVPADKLLLVRRRQYREDTVSLCAVYLVDHTLLTFIIGLYDTAACQTDSPAVSAQHFSDALKVFLCLGKQKHSFLILLQIFQKQL